MLDIQQAINDAMEYCELRYKAEGKYYSLTARQAFLFAGYDQQETRTLLEYCAKEGFEYCLDHDIPCNSGEVNENHKDYGKRIYPPVFATYWGYDQLISRLSWVRKERTYHPTTIHR